MGTIADAKFTHNYNCYNGHFIGCLLIIRYSFFKKAGRLRKRHRRHKKAEINRSPPFHYHYCLFTTSLGILSWTPAGMLSGSFRISILCFTMYGQYFLVPKYFIEARMIVSPFFSVYSA